MKYIHPYFIGYPNVILHIMTFALTFFLSSQFITPLFNNLITKTMGILLILSVFILELISHKTHKQAHTKAQKITKFAKTGIYTYIRHPIYLGWILLNLGAFLFIASWLSLALSLLFIFFWYLEAKSEEKFMLSKFKEYKQYMKQTGRFIPKLN